MKSCLFTSIFLLQIIFVNVQVFDYETEAGLEMKYWSYRYKASLRATSLDGLPR